MKDLGAAKKILGMEVQWIEAQGNCDYLSKVMLRRY